MAPAREMTTTGRPVKLVVPVLLVFILLCGGLYYSKFRANNRPANEVSQVAGPKFSHQVKQLTAAVPSSPGLPTKLVETNNIAVACIRNHDHWRAVYLLTSLVEQYPEKIEPLINLGVALAEVGLWEPAHEYLSRARTLDPKHPLLRENIAILQRAGLFDEFTSSNFGADKGSL